MLSSSSPSQKDIGYVALACAKEGLGRKVEKVGTAGKQIGCPTRSKPKRNAGCELTFPVPPSPTRTSLNVGVCSCAAMVIDESVVKDAKRSKQAGIYRSTLVGVKAFTLMCTVRWFGLGFGLVRSCACGCCYCCRCQIINRRPRNGQ